MDKQLCPICAEYEIDDCLAEFIWKWQEASGIGERSLADAMRTFVAAIPETESAFANLTKIVSGVDTKPRKRFILYDGEGVPIGTGVYYPFGGNCQVWLKSSKNAAWQLSGIGDVLLLDGVARFQWIA